MPCPNWSPNASRSSVDAEVSGGRPDLGDLVRRHARPHELDRGVQPLAAALVGVELRRGRVADVERAVVARPVAVERVDDVEERLVARAQEPVGERVRMRIAAIARDRVDRLHVLGAELEQDPHRLRDDLVLGHPRPQHAVDLLVDRVDDRGRVVEQRQLVLALQPPRLHHHRLRVGRPDALSLQRQQRRHVRNVDPQRLPFRSRARATRRRRGPRASPARRSSPASRRASAAPTSANSTPAATGNTAGDAGQPNRSPTERDRHHGTTRQKRMFLSRSHVPIAVLVTYRRLFGSNKQQRSQIRLPEHRLRTLETMRRAADRNRPAAPSRPPSTHPATQCSSQSSARPSVQRFCTTWRDASTCGTWRASASSASA